MKYITLVNSKQRISLPHNIVSFSDSQILVNIKDNYLKHEQITILSRMSWADLQIIAATVADLRAKYCKEIYLYVPYFLGARSDRSFAKQNANYLKQVICPFINMLNFESVTMMDPHSHCLEMGLNGFDSVSNHAVVAFALNGIVDSTKCDRSKIVWLVPDKGAVDKAYETIKEVYFKGPIVECTKKRDKETGRIIETNIPTEVIFDKEETCLIVDDICDGGRTFIELAKVAKKRGAGKIFLCITHGIFSNGFNDLTQYFECIFTTNSIKDIDSSSIHLLPEVNKQDWFKQLNIF